MLKSLSKNELQKNRTAMGESIVVVCAADDAYAMPLAVTLRSLCKHLPADTSVELYLLDGGIREDSWVGLIESLANQPIEINVIEPNSETFSDLKISHHISHTAYFRLLVAELLPSRVSKAIYLDSDLLICDDISKLWNLPFEDNHCLATVDIACPYIDSRVGAANFRLTNPYLATIQPIRNHKELGIDGRLEYFNSGVMVIDVDRWRSEGHAEKLLRCLRDNRKHIWCWDQYALNVVFAGKWGRFDPRWNQGAHTFEYPSAHHAPIDPQLFVDMKYDPAIVHFTTEFKPWQANSNHPRSKLFYEGLQETAWKNWRPEVPRFGWQDWLNRRSVALVKRATISSRKICSIWA